MRLPLVPGLCALAVFSLGTLAPAVASTAEANAPVANDHRQSVDDPTYLAAVRSTTNMVRDARAQQLAAAHGLRVLNVTWEDTGRFQNSAVGPNISDMTIQVQTQPRPGQYELACMPVIRYDNFTDRSADIDLDRFYVLVGNERGDNLHPVTLRELLGNLRNYLHEPDSWAGDETSLLAPRDTHALVSAQACFLPVPQQGEATFNPVLFNYQSTQGAPAVLTILATREGTSVTIIDNTRDAFQAGNTWGQRLFFNANGQRASLTGRRLTDFRQDQASNQDPDYTGEQTPSAAGEEALNMVLMIQVPLVHPERAWSVCEPCCDEGLGFSNDVASRRSRASDVEAAVIGHGDLEGSFTEIDQLAIERDDRFPIRVTVQFYQATSNGVVDEADLSAIATQIQRVYDEADYVGSLVVDGEVGRPTEHDGPQVEPPDWWPAFWARHQANTGQTPEEAWAMLRERLEHQPRGPEDAQPLLESQ